MAEDMEIYLEEIIKKTNPQEYIKILEEDRQDFAEEINRLQDIIDKAIEHIEKHQLVFQSQYEEMSGFDNHLLDILKGDNK